MFDINRKEFQIGERSRIEMLKAEDKIMRLHRIKMLKMHNRFPSENLNQIKTDENDLFPDFFQNNSKQRINQIEQ